MGLLMCSDFAIKVSNVSKHYQIYEKPVDRLKQSIFRGKRQYYKEFKALKDVSFEIHKGETVGVIGRNGSGKSTLLQIICGTLTPTSGAVEVNGRVAALLELGAGFNPEFSGKENVYMNASILGLSREQIDAKYEDIVDFAEIGEFIDQPVKFYSSGMMVRLAFSVQAMVDPDILIVDEALAVGDEKFQRKCFARLEELKVKGTSILFVSHSSQQIVELCERALFIENGKRIVFENPHDVVRMYQKLIYASADEQKRLVHEYIRNDSLGVNPVATGKMELTHSAQKMSGDGYDESLFPTSTVSYPIQGAEVLSIQILDAGNHVVNILNIGHEYTFKFSGKFLIDSKNVYFGIHIRTISGIEIMGQLYPEVGHSIEKIGAGEKFTIKFGFNMILMPGVYFVGGGIWSKGEPSCLHRVVDLIMFHVSPQEKSMSFGLINGGSHDPIIELS